MRYFFLFLLERLGALPFRWRRALGGGLGYVVRIAFAKDATLSRAICWAHFPACRKKKEKNCCGRISAVGQKFDGRLVGVDGVSR